MGRLFLDTEPAAERVLVAGLRRMSGAEKIERVFALRQTALELAAARMREEGRSEREIGMRLAATWLPPETLREVFGWKPDEPG